MQLALLPAWLLIGLGNLRQRSDLCRSAQRRKCGRLALVAALHAPLLSKHDGVCLCALAAPLDRFEVGLLVETMLAIEKQRESAGMKESGVRKLKNRKTLLTLSCAFYGVKSASSHS